MLVGDSFAQAGIDLDVIGGHVFDDYSFLFERALTDDALAKLKLVRHRFALRGKRSWPAS